MSTYRKRKPTSRYLALTIVLLFVAFVAIIADQTKANNSSSDITHIAVAYTETHNSNYLAPDAELHFSDEAMPIIGRDNIENVANMLYDSYGNTLGVDTAVTDVTALGDGWVMVAYTYTGTLFSGDVYPIELMLDYETIEIDMLALYQIENDLIVREYIMQYETPLPIAINISS